MKTGEKKQFDLEQAFAMWKNKSKDGKTYFSGKYQDGRIIGFANGMKKNPKEPDVRIYEIDEQGNMKKEELTSLWVNVSKNNKKYLSGKLDGKRLIGFIREKATEKQPYFSVYYSESEPKQQETKDAAAKLKIDLPF